MIQQKCNIFPVINICIIVQKGGITAIIMSIFYLFSVLPVWFFRAKDSLGELEVNGTSQDTSDGSQTVVSIIVV